MSRGKRRHVLKCANRMAYQARFLFLSIHLHRCGVCRTFAEAGRHTGRPL